MEEVDEENIRWVLDRQKSDLQGIKTQSRRYLIAAVSATVVLLGALVANHTLIPTEEDLARSLSEVGFMWQLDFLAVETADAVVRTFSLLLAATLSFGVLMFSNSLFYMYSIGQLGHCYPRGDAAELISSEKKKPLQWIETNDEIIEKYDQLLQMIMEMGRMGVVLIIGSAVAWLSLGIMVFIFFGFLYLTLSYFYTTVRNSKVMAGSALLGFMTFAVTVTLLTTPLFFLQNVGYELPLYLSSLAFSVVAVVSVFVAREEFQPLTESLYELLSMAIDAWNSR